MKIDLMEELSKLKLNQSQKENKLSEDIEDDDDDWDYDYGDDIDPEEFFTDDEIDEYVNESWHAAQNMVEKKLSSMYPNILDFDFDDGWGGSYWDVNILDDSFEDGRYQIEVHYGINELDNLVFNIVDKYTDYKNKKKVPVGDPRITKDIAKILFKKVNPEIKRKVAELKSNNK